jgi:riboflavin biosynthesis pyrimidine reductase
VQRVQFYVAPLLCGGPVVAIGGRGAGATAESVRIRNPRYDRLGGNLRLTGEVEYPSAG